MTDNLSRAGKTLLIMGVVVLLVGYVHGLNRDAHSPPTGQTSTAQAELPQSPAQSFEDLLDAIEWVESRGDSNAIGDGGNAIGAYQIWKIYVDDVNNINTFGPKYSYEDRWNRNKSRAMTKTYLYWYIRFTKGIYNKKPEWDNRKWEYMARIHNGGPNGWKKESTEKYWLKIKNYLDNLQ